jgi:hypothetical protein
MVAQNYSDEELEGIRSARQMVEEHIAHNNHLQFLLRQKQRVQQQLEQEVPQCS